MLSNDYKHVETTKNIRVFVGVATFLYEYK